jgi:hypothetical protein
MVPPVHAAARYSFIVMDLHHLLLAGLPAHSASPPKATGLLTHSVALSSISVVAAIWTPSTQKRAPGRAPRARVPLPFTPALPRGEEI